MKDNNELLAKRRKMNFELIATPLFEAAAQTLVGALGGYATNRIINKIYNRSVFYGAFDLWQRGIHFNQLENGDLLYFDGLISPYVQLFPRDPYTNAERWNTLYSFEGKISAAEFSNLEFYAGSDDALRVGQINGETLVGLYDRYGYIGEGLLGVAPSKLIHKKIPDFFNKNFFGSRVRIKATLEKCPAQHGFVAQGLFLKAGIVINVDAYKSIPYLKIIDIDVYNNPNDKICSLLGSPWAATDNTDNPFLIQYGYFSNQDEINKCINNIYKSPIWDEVKVYYDILSAPSESLSYAAQFIL